MVRADDSSDRETKQIYHGQNDSSSLSVRWSPQVVRTIVWKDNSAQRDSDSIPIALA